jgi:hypothetical protein
MMYLRGAHRELRGTEGSNMNIVITAELPMAHSEATPADAVAAVMKRFPGLSLIKIHDGNKYNGGWPSVRLVGEFKIVLDALVSEEGGWCMGEDPEQLIANMQALKPFEL